MASSDCDQLLATYEAEQAQVDAALQQVAELDVQRDALLQQAAATEADAGELEAMLGSLTADINQLTAQQEQARLDRFTEIDPVLVAIIARLAEIDMLLQGGFPDQPGPGAEQVSELFAEAASLDARRQLLQAEEDQLTSGVGDPTHLQPSIDALSAQKASTQALLQEATDLRAAISADLEATAARRQEVEAEVNDANRRATAAREAYENCASGGLEQPDPTGDESPQTDPEQDVPEGTEPAPDDTGGGG
jgi:septal ring factor EnvC (AmiA/AmiB activator)